MAERRMFAKSIIDSDLFLNLPATTQNLYFHLCMRADDDGFVGNPKRIVTLIGAGNTDYSLLLHSKFILEFESGVIVITHWKMHNYIRRDRYTPTIYQEEKSLIIENPRKEYVFAIGIPMVDQRLTTGQPSLGQVRLGKDKDRQIENKLNNFINSDDFFEKIEFVQDMTSRYNDAFIAKGVFINHDKIDIFSLNRMILTQIMLAQELIKDLIDSNSAELYSQLDIEKIEKIFAKMLKQESIEDFVHYFITSYKNEVINNG